MSVKLPVPQPQKIMFKGIFDFDELYRALYDWLVFRGYTFHERKYKAKSKDTGKEREISWKAWRRVTDFYKYWFDIHIQAWNIEPIEVNKDGEKKILTKARLLIEVKGTIELDYDDRFETSKFKKALSEFLINFVFKSLIDSAWADKLQFMQYKVLDVVKHNLDMQIKGNDHFDVW
ncbi:hypothetical protein HN695_00485 [Candidatus Woesearchaeota archaeon]|jgi:hypothetical protein|nr:hypothetical protein [Candidatus Woesearchaeota archaeon]MBT5271812.1 hypothetical protein [Candidatus Woesearchaeota archaeon]MBT6040669.1 hypothetical protein [Candidatus Woesearchaeota archaeon]MBT6336430.1 hypothetical protein [Candidatus Woesearchaeota archaeon]MBT7926790.1 hypothetical protein [Candidatus Woesearchaeota archaeon]